MRKQPTGEPCAGEPHARFGGRGGASLPYTYQTAPRLPSPRLRFGGGGRCRIDSSAEQLPERGRTFLTAIAAKSHSLWLRHGGSLITNSGADPGDRQRSPTALIVLAVVGSQHQLPDAPADLGHAATGDRTLRMQTTARHTLCVALARGNLSACSAAAAAADVSEIEQRRLFNPTEAELASEAAGVSTSTTG